MRSAGNFNSEWGYLAPAPSFMRTARVVLVATAIGATAGAAVVLSLIDRPAGERDKTASIAAHAIVTSVQAAPAMATLAPRFGIRRTGCARQGHDGRSAEGRSSDTSSLAGGTGVFAGASCIASRIGCSAPCHASRDAAGRRDAVDGDCRGPAGGGKCRRERSKCGSRSRAEAGSGICLAV